MATILSDLSTKNALGARGDLSTALVNGDDAAGTVLYATVRMPTTTYTSGDILELVPANLVPIGSVLSPELSTVWCSVLPGASANVLTKIGVGSDDDAYSSSLTIALAKTVYHLANGGTAPAQLTGTPIRVTTQETINATLTFTGTAAATQFVFRIAYIVKG